MGAIEEAWGQHRRIQQALAQATRDYYTGQFNSDSARLTAADVMMELTVQEQAAVRAAMLKAYDLGWYAGDGEYEEQMARIDALGAKEAE